MTQRKNDPFAMPDFGGIFRAFASPALDLSAIAESQRRNMDALLEANRIAAEGYQALMRRQAEIMQSSVTAASELMHAALRQGTEGGPEKGAELARKAMEAGFAHMRELTALVNKAHGDAFAVVQSRLGEQLRELRGEIDKAKAGPKPDKK